MGYIRRPEECGATFSKRWPDAPVDQWDTATCIQEHETTPAPIGTVHDSGDGTRWVELDGFAELDEATLETLAEIARRR